MTHVKKTMLISFSLLLCAPQPSAHAEVDTKTALLYAGGGVLALLAGWGIYKWTRPLPDAQVIENAEELSLRAKKLTVWLNEEYKHYLHEPMSFSELQNKMQNSPEDFLSNLEETIDVLKNMISELASTIQNLTYRRSLIDQSKGNKNSYLEQYVFLCKKLSKQKYIIKQLLTRCTYLQTDVTKRRVYVERIQYAFDRLEQFKKNLLNKYVAYLAGDKSFDEAAPSMHDFSETITHSICSIAGNSKILREKDKMQERLLFLEKEKQVHNEIHSCLEEYICNCDNYTLEFKKIIKDLEKLQKKVESTRAYKDETLKILENEIHYLKDNSYRVNCRLGDLEYDTSSLKRDSNDHYSRLNRLESKVNRLR